MSQIQNDELYRRDLRELDRARALAAARFSSAYTSGGRVKASQLNRFLEHDDSYSRWSCRGLVFTECKENPRDLPGVNALSFVRTQCWSDKNEPLNHRTLA